MMKVSRKKWRLVPIDIRILKKPSLPFLSHIVEGDPRVKLYCPFITPVYSDVESPESPREEVQNLQSEDNEIEWEHLKTQESLFYEELQNQRLETTNDEDDSSKVDEIFEDLNEYLTPEVFNKQSEPRRESPLDVSRSKLMKILSKSPKIVINPFTSDDAVVNNPFTSANTVVNTTQSILHPINEKFVEREQHIQNARNRVNSLLGGDIKPPCLPKLNVDLNNAATTSSLHDNGFNRQTTPEVFFNRTHHRKQTDTAPEFVHESSYERELRKLKAALKTVEPPLFVPRSISRSPSCSLTCYRNRSKSPLVRRRKSQSRSKSPLFRRRRSRSRSKSPLVRRRRSRFTSTSKVRHRNKRSRRHRSRSRSGSKSRIWRYQTSTSRHHSRSPSPHKSRKLRYRSRSPLLSTRDDQITSPCRSNKSRRSRNSPKHSTSDMEESETIPNIQKVSPIDIKNEFQIFKTTPETIQNSSSIVIKTEPIPETNTGVTCTVITAESIPETVSEFNLDAEGSQTASETSTSIADMYKSDNDYIAANTWISQPRKRKRFQQQHHDVFCKICKVFVNTDVQYQLHVASKKHKKKEAILKKNPNMIRPKTPPLPSQPQVRLSCDVCKRYNLNTVDAYNNHMMSIKHMKMLTSTLEKASTIGTYPTANNQHGSTLVIESLNKYSEKVFKTEELEVEVKKKKKTSKNLIAIPCKICDVIFNSEEQQASHLTSKGHMKKLDQLVNQKLQL